MRDGIARLCRLSPHSGTAATAAMGEEMNPYLIGGAGLGIINYFSLFLVLKALTAFDNNGAVFYPIYNVGIIMMSSFAAMLLFSERLSKTNFIGLALSVLALFLLSYQEVIAYFLG